MKIVLQRVAKASLFVENKLISQIGKGLVVYFGAESGDSEESARYLAGKIARMRVFADKQGKMNLSVTDVGGEILSVSQFTLLADISHGNRPDFFAAEKPERAKQLYLKFCEFLEEQGVKTSLGVFGADMTIEQINDGPVTVIAEKK
ncbi:MAG: D-aminoacyl-tRNA deacylase [Corallococcus sp.]|nr:D-aminoacyl-tRNA deacylase [Corallococcus sp.]